MRKRTLSEWAAIAEISASIAVVVSLLFVGYQLYRNTAELQAVQSNDLFDSIREVELVMLTSPHLSALYVTGWYGDRSDISADDLQLFRAYLLQSLTIWEQAHQRRLDGSMSRAEYEYWVAFFSEYLRQGMTDEDLEVMYP